MTHDHQRRVRFIGALESATDDRLRTHDSEIVGAHRQDANAFGTIPGADVGPVLAVRGGSRERFERREIGPVGPVVGSAHERLLGFGAQLVAIEAHQPPRLGVGERPEQHGIDGAEDGGRAPDPNGQCEDGNDGEPRVVPQGAKSLRQIAERVLQEPRAASVAHLFLVALHAAEGDQPLPSRLPALRSRLAILVRRHVHVEAEFLGHLALFSPSKQERVRTRSRASDRMFMQAPEPSWRSRPNSLPWTPVAKRLARPRAADGRQA